MSQRKFIDRLLSFKLKGYRNRIKGIVLDYNKQVTFIKFNPVDYVIDGYAVLVNAYVKEFEKGQSENFAERVIRIKEGAASAPPLKIDSLTKVFEQVNQGYNLFQIQLASHLERY